MHLLKRRSTRNVKSSRTQRQGSSDEASADRKKIIDHQVCHSRPPLARYDHITDTPTAAPRRSLRHTAHLNHPSLDPNTDRRPSPRLRHPRPTRDIVTYRPHTRPPLPLVLRPPPRPSIRGRPALAIPRRMDCTAQTMHFATPLDPRSSERDMASSWRGFVLRRGYRIDAHRAKSSGAWERERRGSSECIAGTGCRDATFSNGFRGQLSGRRRATRGW